MPGAERRKKPKNPRARRKTQTSKNSHSRRELVGKVWKEAHSNDDSRSVRGRSAGAARPRPCKRGKLGLGACACTRECANVSLKPPSHAPPHSPRDARGFGVEARVMNVHIACSRVSFTPQKPRPSLAAGLITTPEPPSPVLFLFSIPRRSSQTIPKSLPAQSINQHAVLHLLPRRCRSRPRCPRRCPSPDGRNRRDCPDP